MSTGYIFTKKLNIKQFVQPNEINFEQKYLRLVVTESDDLGDPVSYQIRCHCCNQYASVDNENNYYFDHITRYGIGNSIECIRDQLSSKYNVGTIDEYDEAYQHMFRTTEEDMS